MITYEIDNQITLPSALKRFDEIKKNKLHNIPISKSGFMNSILNRVSDSNPITMMYVLHSETLIGWAYIHKLSVKPLIYDAGSYINKDHRRNGYATHALKLLVDHYKRNNKKVIRIDASGTTKDILIKAKDPKLEIRSLFLGW